MPADRLYRYTGIINHQPRSRFVHRTAPGSGAKAMVRGSAPMLHRRLHPQNASADWSTA
jgi:hypothetical protein